MVALRSKEPFHDRTHHALPTSPTSAHRPAGLVTGPAVAAGPGMVTSPPVPLGFEAHPEALRDLRRVPSWVRDSVLLALQQLVQLQHRGPLLAKPGPFARQGCREIHLDPGSQWRAVYLERPAPPGAHSRFQIYLLGVGTRANATAPAAGRRLPLTTARTTREDAALARSAHAPDPGDIKAPVSTPPPSAAPAARPQRHS